MGAKLPALAHIFLNKRKCKDNFLSLSPVPGISTISPEGFSACLPHGSVFLLGHHIYPHLMVQEIPLLDTVQMWKVHLRSDLLLGEINCMFNNFGFVYLDVKEIIILTFVYWTSKMCQALHKCLTTLVHVILEITLQEKHSDLRLQMISQC